MGYRSEVVIGMSKNDYLYGLKWMKLRGVPDELNLLLPSNCEKVLERENKIIISHSYIKWYTGYKSSKDLVALYKFLGTIGEERYGIYRVGEDVGDVEHESNVSILDMMDVYPVCYLSLNESTDDKQVIDNIIKEDTKYRFIVNLGDEEVDKWIDL